MPKTFFMQRPIGENHGDRDDMGGAAGEERKTVGKTPPGRDGAKNTPILSLFALPHAPGSAPSSCGVA
jgi:hypothetical protein